MTGDAVGVEGTVSVDREGSKITGKILISLKITFYVFRTYFVNCPIVWILVVLILVVIYARFLNNQYDQRQ